jgi:uncharacterized membrane protein YjgN (DUF898 family)
VESPTHAIAATENLYAIEFRARGSEYFRIWIVNLFLTIVTLGVFSAWAKVRRQRYFYGSTLLAGQAFEYHGRPLPILKGRLIAVGGYVLISVAANVWPLTGFLVLPFLAFIIPWIVMTGRRFQMRMTSWRNLRFGFHGTYGNALAAYVGWYALTIFSLGILTPVWLQRRVTYALGQGSFGAESFTFSGTPEQFYRFWLRAVGLGIVLFVVVIIVGTTIVGSLWSLGVAVPAEGDTPSELIAFLPTAVFFAAYALGGMFVLGYYRASFNNVAFGRLSVGDIQLKSSMRALPLARIYLSNLLLLIVTLGLYYPWAKIRQARYQLENLRVAAPQGLDHLSAGVAETAGATGEELGSFFDVDFGF